MSTAALQVANGAQDAAQAADAAESEGLQASRVVSESVENIYGLVENLEASGTSLDQLQKEVRDIGGVVGVIRSIADQTNLLALNAAIEAARAGDAGRGFAVVADEVRALASRTQASTEEIQSMISRLQKGTESTVLAMKLSSEAGTASREQASRATTSLSNIAKLIGTITSMNAQIASAANQQTAVSDEINRSIHQMAIAVDDVARDTRQGAETARDLAVASDSLHIAVNRFRI
jgi:methyl-accepting chemotaxis protein